MLDLKIRTPENGDSEESGSEGDQSEREGAEASGTYIRETQPLVADRETDAVYVKQRAETQIKNLKTFKEETWGILKEVHQKLAQINALVAQNLNSGANMDGFLLGKLKEYALALDRESFDLRLDLDIELWEA